LGDRKDFKFEHCWEILKDTEKFSNPPTMNVGSSRPPPTVDLEDDATPPDETVPRNAVLHARPPGQKAQKAAKKKGKLDEAALMRAQIQRFADQADRDYALRQQLIEDTKAAEERAEQNKEAAARRADDAHTMTINPSQFTPVKRAYWERKQRQILQREEECDADMPHSQSHDGGNRSNLSLYVPVHDTDFLD
jgi:hypothetical protein